MLIEIFIFEKLTNEFEFVIYKNYIIKLIILFKYIYYLIFHLLF